MMHVMEILRMVEDRSMFPASVSIDVKNNSDVRYRICVVDGDSVLFSEEVDFRNHDTLRITDANREACQQRLLRSIFCAGVSSKMQKP